MSESILTTQLVEPEDGFTLRLSRKPELVIQEATLCANALLSAVRRNNWAQKFGNREHLFFEAWSFLASMYRVTPRTKETRFFQLGDVIGFEATAEAFHVPSGIVISTADSMCLNDEENWSMQPKYTWDAETKRKVKTGDRPVPLFQLRSMCQTRAQAKALKGPFSWIVAMAGYAPTSAEEMREGGATSQPQTQHQQQSAADAAEPKERAKTSAAPGCITGKQASRLWALGFSAGIDKKMIGEIIRGYGYERAEQIQVERYDEICGHIERLGAEQKQKKEDF